MVTGSFVRNQLVLTAPEEEGPTESCYWAQNLTNDPVTIVRNGDATRMRGVPPVISEATYSLRR